MVFRLFHSIQSIRNDAVIVSISKGHLETIFDCKFKPDNPNYLATGSFDGTIKVWNIITMEAVRNSILPLHPMIFHTLLSYHTLLYRSLRLLCCATHPHQLNSWRFIRNKSCNQGQRQLHNNIVTVMNVCVMTVLYNVFHTPRLQLLLAMKASYTTYPGHQVTSTVLPAAQPRTGFSSGTWIREKLSSAFMM